MRKWFDEYGWILETIPEEAVEDCSQPGVDAYPYVIRWIEELEFKVPEDLTRAYLDEFGAWEDLETADQLTLASRVFWIACNDMQENGEWLGLVH